MSEETTQKQYFDLKIARLDSRGKILSVTDPDSRPVWMEPGEDKNPKLQLDFTEYSTETNKAIKTHRHWVDADVFHLLAWDFLTGKKGEKNGDSYVPLLDEFKGGKAGKTKLEGVTEDMILSRRLTVVYTDALTKIGPAYQFKFVVTDGRKGETGQIMPVKGAKPYLTADMTVALPIARRFGMTICNYLQGKTAAALSRIGV